MCGIAGFYYTDVRHSAERSIIEAMTRTLAHRGPDDSKVVTKRNVALGFRRLTLVDPAAPPQPMSNETSEIVTVCNGEIFNHKTLAANLKAHGHVLTTRCDCELIPHLFEEHGLDLFTLINGQFAMSIYDSRSCSVHLARDQFGIIPLFYTVLPGAVVFASEVKAIFRFPGVARDIDPVGLEQVRCFPGLVSPQTMFKGIFSVKPGTVISVTHNGITEREFWDLEYPTKSESVSTNHDESYYVNAFTERLLESVALRLQGDTNVGIYLSGGLDSSLMAGMAHALTPSIQRSTFSAIFSDAEMSESHHQDAVVRRINGIHHAVPCGPGQVIADLNKTVYHAESVLKETYDTACLALARQCRSVGIPAILTGQGADELFGGYIGYRYDRFLEGAPQRVQASEREREIRSSLWGDTQVIYDNNYSQLERDWNTLYTAATTDALIQYGFFERPLVNTDRLKDRHPFHQRSYLDFKLRLGDHLLSEHGDRMAMAHGVELRHPILDPGVIELALQTPPELMLKSFTEKYLLRKVSEPYVSEEIITREKFGWYSSSTPGLMKCDMEWFNDLLSRDRIVRGGVFRWEEIDKLKTLYQSEDFYLAQPFETDLLALALTFNVLCEQFEIA